MLHLQNLLQLYVILHDNNLAAGVFENIVAGVGRVGCVYATSETSVYNRSNRSIILGTCEWFFFRSNRISNRIGRLYHASRNRAWRTAGVPYSSGVAKKFSRGEQKLEGSGPRPEVPQWGPGAKPRLGVWGLSPPRSWRFNRKKPSNLSSREHYCAYCCSNPWGLSISSLDLSPTLLEQGSQIFHR